jgi:hypothetical protein
MGPLRRSGLPRQPDHLHRQRRHQGYTIRPGRHPATTAVHRWGGGGVQLRHPGIPGRRCPPTKVPLNSLQSNQHTDSDTGHNLCTPSLGQAVWERVGAIVSSR